MGKMLVSKSRGQKKEEKKTEKKHVDITENRAESLSTSLAALAKTEKHDRSTGKG